MVRKVIITTLTVLAMATLAADLVSRWRDRTNPNSRSYVDGDSPPHHLFEDGYLHVLYTRVPDQTEPDRFTEWGALGLRYTDVVMTISVMGATGTGTTRWYWTMFDVPLWMPLVLFAAYPLVAFVRGPLRRWRRAKRGACRKCGYDLTGNVSGRCPECGKGV